MHWNGDWHMGWMGPWWILIVPVLIAVSWFALSAARRRGDGAQESPEQVLKRMDRSIVRRTNESSRSCAGEPSRTPRTPT